MAGNLNAFLLKVVALLVLFPQLEFADQVMLPMASAIAVEFAEVPLNLVASVETEFAGFVGS